MIAPIESVSKNLTLEQELALGGEIQKGKYTVFRNRTSRIRVNSFYFDKNATNARNILVEHYMGYAKNLAYKFHQKIPSISFNEFLSESQDILIYAAERYDYKRGYKFSTLLGTAIPRRLFKLASDEIKQISGKIGFAEFFYQNSKNYTEQEYENDHEKEIIKKILKNYLNQLTQNQKTVLERRILREKSQTLEEVGVHLNLTKERIRQIQIAALECIRKRLTERDEETLRAKL